MLTKHSECKAVGNLVVGNLCKGMFGIKSAIEAHEVLKACRARL